ncbi:MAG: DNA primase [Gammaproteobacteria bacterium 28-57-27]|nr:MAG: DNA primase [Gammaproteobacteria bacterium 28-57-27]
MSRIPQSFIDDLVTRADIVDVVGSRVPLKKKGKEYTACCPFHHEKSPSFFVSPEKQFYHCFGCGAHGTVLSFLMAHDRLDFVEAIETLAGQMGMEVPREGGNTPSENPHAPLLAILEECSKYYQGELKRTPKAIDYLKQRGVSGEVAALFGLGYAPAGYDTLERVLNANDGTRDQLKRAGMLSEGEQGRLYDRFRERIMFPIRDRRGRVIAFGGRVLNDDKPKYLNSPETPLFHKGAGLYGLYEARKALGRPERLLVVEGYMDVVMLAQHGVREAVATLGTAVTREQVDLMYRNTAQVIYCFDGDEAGRRAAWRALESTLPQLRDGLDARFMFLPDGEDPDSLVRQEGAEAFRKRIQADAVSFDHFLLSELEQQTEHDGSPAARAKLKSLAQPLIQLMPESTLKDLVFDALAKQIGTRVSRLQNTPRNAEPAERRRIPPPSSSSNTRHSAIRKAILYLLYHPELAGEHELDPAWAHSTTPGFALLSELVNTLRAQPMPLGILLERYRDSPHLKTLDALACLPAPQDSEDELVRQNMWHDMLNHLAAAYTRDRLRELTSKSFDQLQKDERQELLRLSAIKATS